MIEHVFRHTIPAAFALLPPQLGTVEAAAMLLAIGLQESRFRYRRQVKGPARGFWQFEVAGVRGVIEHDRTNLIIGRAMQQLRYDPGLEAADVQPILEHNDVLAACFARCLLWTTPYQMPPATDAALAWTLYLDAWRPGKPHRETWDTLYVEAWSRVTGRYNRQRTENV